MQIKRTLLAFDEVLKRLERINKVFVDSIAKKDEIQHRFSIDFTDEEYIFNSYDEYLDTLGSIPFEKLTSFYLLFKAGHWTVITISGYHSQQSTDIEIRGTSSAELEDSFRKIAAIFPETKFFAHTIEINIEEEQILDSQEDVTSKCIEVLRSFQSYFTRLKGPVRSEVEFQDFVYPILKSHFVDLVDENPTPKFAGKSQRPDFTIASAKLCIECKYLRHAEDFKKFRTEICEDIIGFIRSGTSYTQLIVVIYNASHDAVPAGYLEDLEKNPEIKKVFIIPGHLDLPKNSKASRES